MINNIWILIGKRLNGEASDDELCELTEFIKQTGNEYPIEVLEQIWIKNSGNVQKSIAELERKWQAFDDKLDLIETENKAAVVQTNREPKKTFHLFYKITAWAAVFIIFIGAIWIISAQHKDEDQRLTSVIAPQNGISKIQLPDGSKVWLNSGSRIIYKNNNITKCREVSLTGEAFFDVVKDAQHPFIVQTATIKIKVLGTAFNVRSYPNDITSEATLLRGRIELTVLKSPDRQFILKPLEKMTIENVPLLTAKAYTSNTKSHDTETPDVTLIKVHQSVDRPLPAEVMWMDNIIAFDNTDFAEIAKKLERRYNVSISFKNDKTKKLKFTGNFQSESLTQVLKALQSTVYFHFKIENNEVIIY